MPGIGGDEYAAGVRLVGLDAARAEKDAGPVVTQLLDAAAERCTSSKRRVNEGEDHDRHAKGAGLGEDA